MQNIFQHVAYTMQFTCCINRILVKNSIMAMFFGELADKAEKSTQRYWLDEPKKATGETAFFGKKER